MSCQEKIAARSTSESEIQANQIPNIPEMSSKISTEIRDLFLAQQEKILIPISEWQIFQQNFLQLQRQVEDLTKKCRLFEAMFRQQSLLANWSPNLNLHNLNGSQHQIKDPLLQPAENDNQSQFNAQNTSMSTLPSENSTPLRQKTGQRLWTSATKKKTFAQAVQQRDLPTQMEGERSHDIHPRIEPGATLSTRSRKFFRQ